MLNNVPKLAIGFITYGQLTAKYLPYFLPSLKKQTFQDFKIIARDNSDNQANKNKDYIEKNYPGIEFRWSGGNIGFAKAYNKMISRATALGAKYFLVINPDIILETDAIEKMIIALDQDKGLGSVCPKILRWDFADNKKTNIIDSCGIKIVSALRFTDLGQGEEYNGQYDQAEIFGPSGAAAMYRLSALEKNKFNGQYFDELMFMYEEDCDLAYRLKLAGYKSKLVPQAIIYHDRTASARGVSNLQVALNRGRKSRQVKSWAFLNKHIIFVKYWVTLNFREKLSVLWFAARMFVFALLFEQYLLKQYWQLWKIRKKITIYQ